MPFFQSLTISELFNGCRSRGRGCREIHRTEHDRESQVILRCLRSVRPLVDYSSLLTRDQLTERNRSSEITCKMNDLTVRLLTSHGGILPTTAIGSTEARTECRALVRIHGQELIDNFRRAKIVLNVHFSTNSSTLETVRLAFLCPIDVLLYLRRVTTIPMATAWFLQTMVTLWRLVAHTCAYLKHGKRWGGRVFGDPAVDMVSDLAISSRGCHCRNSCIVHRSWLPSGWQAANFGPFVVDVHLLCVDASRWGSYSRQEGRSSMARP